MTSLNKPILGTDPKRGWQYYSLHLASSYVVKEFFLASNYKDCIRQAERHGQGTKKALEGLKKIGTKVPNEEMILATADGLSKWAVEMREQEYHEVYTHAFVGMFAAFEAGVEDTIAAVVMNDRKAAEGSSDKLKGKFSIAEWPWSRDMCIEVARRLEKVAIRLTNDGGPNLFERLKTLYAFLEIEIEADSIVILNLAEANLVRNVTLHRYGELSEEDIRKFPALSAWLGKVVPMEKERFTSYYHALTGTLMAIMAGMRKSRYVRA